MNFVAVCVFFIFLADARASIVSELELHKEWTDFKKTYVKRYDDPEQEEMRKKIFADRLEFIKKHNEKYAQGLSSYSMGVNQFADLTQEEFRDRIKCLVIPENLQESTPQTHTDYNDKDLPEEVDWTKKGVVTEVKAQGLCGSCWAFSAVGAMETAQALKSGRLVELSAEQLVDCDDSNDGCHGGLPILAFEYVVENGGIENGTAYPYTAGNDECLSNAENIKYNFRGYSRLPVGDEKALQKAVATLGAISVGINVDSFGFYNHGVFDEPACSRKLNHGVTVVGYGTLNGKEYWKVKNSWGKRWGMDGYVLMARNKNNQCGIASFASYPIV